MAISATEAYGTNVSLDTSGTSPVLQINLGDLTEAGDLSAENGLDSSTVNSWSSLSDIDSNNSKIAAALLLLRLANQPNDTSTQDTLGMVVEEPRKRFITRNGSNQIEFSFVANFYTPDSSSSLDPDNVTVAS